MWLHVACYLALHDAVVRHVMLFQLMPPARAALYTICRAIFRAQDIGAFADDAYAAPRCAPCQRLIRVFCAPRSARGAPRAIIAACSRYCLSAIR